MSQRFLALLILSYALIGNALCSQGPANIEIYEGLLMLQHRGQDSAGMVTLKDGRKFVEHKANGLVKDVFNNTKTMDKLQGMFASAQVVSSQRASPASVHEMQSYAICCWTTSYAMKASHFL